MIKAHYRFYRLDGAGRLHEAEWFEAESDEIATALVEAKYPGSRCEIWQGTRLVAQLAPKPVAPDYSSIVTTDLNGTETKTAP